MGVLRAKGKRLYAGDYESTQVRISDGKNSVVFQPYDLTGVGSTPYYLDIKQEELIEILDQKNATIAVPYRKGDSPPECVHLFNPKGKRVALGKLGELEKIVSKKSKSPAKSPVIENKVQNAPESQPQQASELAKLEEVYQGTYGGFANSISGVRGKDIIKIRSIEEATRIGFIQIYTGSERRTNEELAKEARERGGNLIAIYEGKRRKKSKPGILLKLNEAQVREAKRDSVLTL